jgi:uncharacterized protein (DUF302 family)
MPSQKVPGVEQLESPHSFSDTVAKLENILQAKGLQLFAKIDFSGDAGRNGISMPQTVALLFGNPKAGTPVMMASPSSALDLPLKIVAAENADKLVSVMFNTPEYLAQRHGIPAELLQNIAGIRKIAEAAVS